MTKRSEQSEAGRHGARSRRVCGSAAELAWRLERLCEAGARVRDLGWCLGELRSGDLTWGDECEPRRLPVRSRWRSALYEHRRRRHLRRGHDSGCVRLGVPLTTARHLLREWDGVGAAEWLGEAVTEMAEQAGHRPATLEEVRYSVRIRITPRKNG